MRTQEQIDDMANLLSNYRSKCGKDEELQWKVRDLSSQIEVLDWVLENAEDDVFDEEALHPEDDEK